MNIIKNVKSKLIFYLPVLCISSGGLGNQLFISAFAHEMKKMRKHVFLLYSPWNARGQDSIELQELCLHNIKYHGKTYSSNNTLAKKFVKFFNQLRGYLINLLTFIAIDVVDRFTSPEPNWNYFVFKGCLQRAELAMGNPEFVQELLDFLRIRVQNPISDYRTLCHVRRGDYVGNDYYGILAPKFYSDALLLLGEKSPYVVSDDNRTGIDIAKLLNGVYLDTSKLSPWQLLKVMSESTAVISANSSLSWWGGFLSFSKGGRHLIPTPWLQGTSDEGRWLSHSGSYDVVSVFDQ